MQDLPAPQVPEVTHCAVASAEERHTRSLAQKPMRLSIVRQYWSPWTAVQEYLQKPLRHLFGVAAVPPHCESSVQFGFGRVSVTHAP